MAPPLTLFSFAALNSPNLPPRYRPRRTHLFEPHRWLPLHIEPLKIVIKDTACHSKPTKAVARSSRDEKADRDIKIVETFLRTLHRPESTHPGLLKISWTLSRILSCTPVVYLGSSSAVINNSHTIQCFLWLANAIINPRLQLTVYDELPIHSFARPLRFRHNITWLIPDMCIFRDPLYGPLPFFIPVVFPEAHRRSRVPLAREIALILAYAQQRFRDSDAVLASEAVQLSVRVVILHFTPSETFFISSEVKRSYLDSIEKDGVASETLQVWTSERWDLKTGDGRWGFLMGLKSILQKIFPPIVYRGPGQGRKRKWDEIS